MPGFFVPGWGASASLYRPVLPEGWTALEQPSFRSSRGSLPHYVDWLHSRLDEQRVPFALGGHSFGAALAVLAALESDAPVERLVLVAPAGLPLAKPIRKSMSDFARQVSSGFYPALDAARAIGSVLAAPRAALRLANLVRDLDLTTELEQLRARGVACSVIASATDSLTTPGHCRRIARFLDADYRELPVEGGHVWFLQAAALHRRQLAL